jgi:putative ABC transport system permease protein
MDSELCFHLEQQIRDYMERGLTRPEAERRARQEFGTVDVAKDECRDARRTAWIGHLGRDIRHACRSLAKSPGFAAAAVATLALGIGANTAIFSVIHSILLKPLPYPAPERVFSVGTHFPQNEGQGVANRIQDYMEWRSASTAFESITALTPANWNLTGDGEPERLGGALVSTNFFSFLGAPPSLGRAFEPGEETPGKDRVVVISDALWRRRYGADRSVLGRTVVLNAVPYVIVGVAPPSLLVPTGTLLHPTMAFGPRVDVWKPIAPTNEELDPNNENWNYGLLVRLRKGENAERGRQQLQAIQNASIRRLLPDVKVELITSLTPIREIYSSNLRLRLLLIFAASGVLLLAACTNIANLFLARAARRATELATRIALGAGRVRIVSHLLTESLLLALLGGMCGALAASSGVRLLAAYGPPELSIPSPPEASAVVLWFTLLVSVAAGVICGALPAWQAFRKDAAAVLQEGARSGLGAGSTRMRQVLIAVEMTLGTALLASAGLLLHSFVNVMSASRGYAVERILSVDLGLFDMRYARRTQRAAFYRELSEHIQALPGVVAAGAVSGLPANSGESAGNQRVFYTTDTHPPAVAMQRPAALVRSVTIGYFAASGTALRAGRFFAQQEHVPVALISESLARRLWPNEPVAVVVGHTFRQGDFDGPPTTIVGVVEDTRPGALDRELPPEVYRPQDQRAAGGMSLVVRTAQDPAALAAAVRVEIRKMDPDLPIPTIRTMREIISQTVAQRRFQMMLTALFALAALCLGAIGIYGVVSYAVACRTRDIGLRMALGAVQADVMRWVFAIGFRPVLIGLAAGLLSAMAVGTAARSLLYGISPADAASLAGVAALLLLTSALACYMPARRASQMDPAAALRHE